MSTTLLSDIIDLNDPSNENEAIKNIPYTNIPQYNNMDFNNFNNKPINNHSNYPIHDKFSNHHNTMNHTNTQYTPQISNLKQINTTPITPIKHVIHNQFNQSEPQTQSHDQYDTNIIKDENVKHLTDKYEELCQICKKVNDNNNMVHGIYITVIATMAIILLLLVKKLMSN